MLRDLVCFSITFELGFMEILKDGAFPNLLYHFFQVGKFPYWNISI